jgi:hypothetical protein
MAGRAKPQYQQALRAAGRSPEPLLPSSAQACGSRLKSRAQAGVVLLSFPALRRVALSIFRESFLTPTYRFDEPDRPRCEAGNAICAGGRSMNILDVVAANPAPGDVAHSWSSYNVRAWAFPTADEELEYIDFYMSDEVPSAFRMPKGVAYPNTLTDVERQHAAQMFGDSLEGMTLFAFRETRLRIVKHHVFLHPLMIQYYGALYRLFRDVNPAHFTVERVYEIGTGREMFTGIPVSRGWAAVELMIPIVLGRVFRLVLSGVGAVPAPVEAPTSVEPVWNLPPKGGTWIRGRYFTEHALERMAPDTPEVRAELNNRAIMRLRRLGIPEGSDEWNMMLHQYLKKVDPRGISPTVVEAEIKQPGSTNVKVILATIGKRTSTMVNKFVVVTVIPRH